MKLTIYNAILHKTNYGASFCRHHQTASHLSKLDKAYVPHKLDTYAGKERYFKAKTNRSEPFTMILPPPNITGTLHLGHALTATIQDTIIRWKQMQGTETVWVPGVDHAGIATQTVVEKLLWKTTGQTRHDLGREEFLKKIHEWKNENTRAITEQLKRLELSLNWDREIFTLDEERSKAVNEAFVRLFDKGLIYRANALVNWSCTLKSAISDIEVEDLSITGPTELNVPGYERPVEFGYLDRFAYLVDGTDEEIIVSTTRLETMLGDVAVAVHPNDERYSKFIGKFLRHPFRNDRIPVIADSFVDRDFGTGAVKITPAHDFADFDVARRHSLRHLSIIDESGRTTDGCGPFSGLPRFEARLKVAEELTRLGRFRGRRRHAMVVPVCSRSKDVVEYLIRPQWFLRCDAMAAEAVRCVKEGRLVLVPEGLRKDWFDWLEHVRDWCVSRQLWWGHRIPVYRCTNTRNGETAWIAAQDEASASDKASMKLNCARENVELQQDEDVLDTWFSSALHPFSAFGWPAETEDLSKFYPLSLMETGRDIMFFWAARMVMLGVALTGRLPFGRLLLHGIVCDAHGRKMSKSLGNVVAPEEIIDGITSDEMKSKLELNYNKGFISKEEFDRSLRGQRKMFPKGVPECGIDALRFTLLSHDIKKRFVNFDVSECHVNKLFCNKIWQSTRFALSWYDELRDRLVPVGYEDSSSTDRWILSKLSGMIDRVSLGLENCDFCAAAKALKQFLYYEFCDVYLETSKRGLRNSEGDIKTASVNLWTILTCLDTSLRCLAPFMPVVSRHLHSRLPSYDRQRNTGFPERLNWSDDKLEEQMDELMDVVVAVRRLKNVFNVNVHSGAEVCLATTFDFLLANSRLIEDLTGFRRIDVVEGSNVQLSGDFLTDRSRNTSVYVKITKDFKKTLTLDLEKVLVKKAKVEKELDRFRKMMGHENYSIKTDEARKLLDSKRMAALEEQLSRLEYFRIVAER
ncbi:unnamed protein product [Phyllotreta striolata]|uniref:valine--tRNA ligase n=1 Tax=Phyllotreta striolata TaxID=444603 RepID=A0A9N9TMA2_PHYSR|nr:unnamed protein product [Phyllotreta striolata]